jgi:hypothetical protein
MLVIVIVLEWDVSQLGCLGSQAAEPGEYGQAGSLTSDSQIAIR